MADKNSKGNHVDLSIQDYFSIIRAGRKMKEEATKDDETMIEEPMICNGRSFTTTTIPEDENEM